MSGADDKPLLVLDRVGKGRVAELLSDQGWLWARGFEGGGPEAELLRRLAHWLMKEPELEEERLTAAIAGGDIVDRAAHDGRRAAARDPDRSRPASRRPSHSPRSSPASGAATRRPTLSAVTVLNLPAGGRMLLIVRSQT